MPRPTAQIESTDSSLLRAWRDEADRLDIAAYAAIAATPTPTMDVGLRRLSGRPTTRGSGSAVRRCSPPSGASAAAPPL
jgi:hypothetical protein